MKTIREVLLLAMPYLSFVGGTTKPSGRRKQAGRFSSTGRLGFEQFETRNLLTASSLVVADVVDANHLTPAHTLLGIQDTLNISPAVTSADDGDSDEEPTVTLAGLDGATDGSGDATATFTASGGSSGATATIGYTISGPGVSQSSSVSLSDGQISSLSFAYNPLYGSGQFSGLHR